jgi:hypothetical protein
VRSPRKEDQSGFNPNRVKGFSFTRFFSSLQLSPKRETKDQSGRESDDGFRLQARAGDDGDEDQQEPMRFIIYFAVFQGLEPMCGRQMIACIILYSL